MGLEFTFLGSSRRDVDEQLLEMSLGKNMFEGQGSAAATVVDCIPLPLSAGKCL